MAIKLLPNFSTSPTSASSATLKPVVKTTPKPPVTLVTNSGKSSAASTSNAIPVSNSTAKQNGGWYWNPATGQSEQYWANGQPSSNPFNNVGIDDGNAQLEAEINSMRDSQLASLDQYANYLKGEDYNTGVSEIDRNVAQQYGVVENRKKDSEELTQQDLNTLGISRENAMQKAIRDRLAIQQRGAVRFGRGNSAGQAATEIADQAYFQGNAGIEQAFAQEQGEIFQRAQSARRFYDEKLGEIDFWKQTELANLKKALNDKLMEINMKKEDVKGAASMQRLQLLQAAQEQMKQVKLADAQFRQNLQLAVAEKIASINGDYAGILKKFNIDTTSEPYMRFSMNPTDYGRPVTVAQPTQTYMNTLARRSYQEEEENPFYA